MGKDNFYINHDFFKILGIDPQNGVKYLESKDASTIDPVHVKALEVLKKMPLVPS